MIVGVTGPAGAGKDTVSDYIEQKYSFKHISGGNVLREMLTAIGFNPKKEAVSDLGALLRKNYGTDAILQLVIQKGGTTDIVVSGFRSLGEARLIQRSGGLILFVDAPQVMRHERIAVRARPDELNTDMMATDKKEAKSKNSLEESLDDIRPLADFTIVNDGSIEQLHTRIDAVFSKLPRQTSS